MFNRFNPQINIKIWPIEMARTWFFNGIPGSVTALLNPLASKVGIALDMENVLE
jgi:hypothetical protein